MEIDEMKGLSDKGKALLKNLRLERLVDDSYLRALREKYKDFFNRTTNELVELQGMTIGGEVLNDLFSLYPDIEGPLNDIYEPKISSRANFMAASQGVLLYILYCMKKLGLEHAK